jgi:hypothetical protein
VVQSATVSSLKRLVEVDIGATSTLLTKWFAAQHDAILEQVRCRFVSHLVLLTTHIHIRFCVVGTTSRSAIRLSESVVGRQRDERRRRWQAARATAASRREIDRADVCARGKQLNLLLLLLLMLTIDD